jgi:Flp pilus assembly protein TadG
MALVAPVILLLIFGSIEFARMMMVRQALTNAAREGCRTACLATTQADQAAKTEVRESLRGVIADATTTSDLRITIQPAFTTSPNSGTTITTSVEIDCEDVSWLPPFLTQGAQIRCSSSMNRE